MRKRRLKRRYVSGLRRCQPLAIQEADACWPMDFMSDAQRGSRQIRFLTIVDSFTREGLVLVIC